MRVKYQKVEKLKEEKNISDKEEQNKYNHA